MSEESSLGSVESTAVLSYHQEAKNAKQDRMDQNKLNWNAYHLNGDYSHKKRGQSKEFLPKQMMATEQLASFITQGLIDFGPWFSVEPMPGVDDDKMPLRSDDIQKLLGRQLDKNQFGVFLNDLMKATILAADGIVKVGGLKTEEQMFEASEDLETGRKDKLKRFVKELWQLDLSYVRAEDWYPDPTGRGLYNQQIIEMDWYELMRLANLNPGEFNVDVISGLNVGDKEDRKHDVTRETNQNMTVAGSSLRRTVTFIEHWGKILDPTTGQVLHDNIVCRYATDGREISAPMANPLWHGKDPYVVGGFMRVPGSQWHKAVADAPTQLNNALNELYNLILDGGLMSVWGIKQLRTDLLEDPGQVADGIPPGETLGVNSSTPPGVKVLERVDTGTPSSEAVNTFNLTDREFQSAAFTNDVRMGNLPERNVKATEIVSSNQALTGVLNGVVKLLEESFVRPILEKSWLTIAQNMDDLNEQEVKSLLGEERASVVSSMTRAERFAKTAQGFKFKVFGLSATIGKVQDFRTHSTLLQTVAANPLLMQEFRRNFSMNKFFQKLLSSLNIDPTQLTPSKEEQDRVAQEGANAQRAAELEVQQDSPDEASQQPDQFNQAAPSDLRPPNAANEQGNTTP